MNIVPDADAVRRVPRTLRAAVGGVPRRPVGRSTSPRRTFPSSAVPPRPRAGRRSSLSASTFPIVGVATHLPSGRFRMAFEPVEIARTGDLERDTDALLSAYSRALERFVRADPGSTSGSTAGAKVRPPEGTPLELGDPAQ